MTPTPEQIREEIFNRFQESISVEALQFALTAAAGVGEKHSTLDIRPDIEAILKARGNIEAATIERCAQVADEYTSGGGADGVSGIHKQIAAAIRALKDKP